MNATSGETKRRLGIMGGGQLGMFLCQAARELGVETTVLEPNPAGSALPFADRPIVASLGDLTAVAALIDHSDTITFELEAIPDESLDLLRKAEQEGRITVHPSIETLSRFKDKGDQKAWLVREGLPTLPFLSVSGGRLPATFHDEGWTLPVVQKAHRGGYDGRGVQLLREDADLDRLWDVPSYLEPALIPCLELSVVVCRGEDGTLLAYPPVSMTFDDRYNAVHSVASPAQVEPALVEEAERIALEAIGRLDTPGVFAVELFVDPARKVTINEISPRVHNSGHLGLEGFRHSQFEQHVRAVMALPLAPIESTGAAAEMVNILYDERLEAACPPKPRVTELPADEPVRTLRVHWYGKSTGQPGRKMGHITAVGDSAALVHAAAEGALDALLHPAGEGDLAGGESRAANEEATTP
jgi:5-(carboxyamino)imidazole ribonucleotide synthase